MAERTHGTMQVDWEQRTDLDRLRRERLARAKSFLAESELGALLCFDMANIRYITATHIGTWAMDKLVRFCLLPQNDEPIMWDFGSAGRHHKLYSPWLGEERSRAGISTLRGAVKGRAEDVARKIRVELEERGLLSEPVGVDMIELPVLEALEGEGVRVVDGQALMQDVRKIKTADEVTLLTTACTMVDAAYEELFRAMRCRDILDHAISLIRPGATTADVVSIWPEAHEFGLPDEEAAFALQYGHGDYPETIEEGMVFALETFWPASDGWSAARIEEQLVVTADGCEVITRFPAEELLVAGGGHPTASGPLPGIREPQSNLNNAVVASARFEGAGAPVD
jgi:Xaa-Pro aminopeptidase